MVHIGYGSLFDIKEVVIDRENPNMVRDGAFFLSKDRLSVYGLATKVKNVTLPAVQCLMNESFRKSNIRVLVIPKTIRRIGSGAFVKCNKLEKVIFESGSGIVSIGRRCFSKCQMMYQVSFSVPMLLRMFSEKLFKSCNIFSLCVPDSVRTIDSLCFSCCSRLSSIVFTKESRLKRICDRAFEKCGLYCFEAPASLAFLGSDVFSLCENLESVSFATVSSIAYIGPGCFATCKQLKGVSLPDTIYMMHGRSFSLECEVRMKSADSELLSAFERWSRERKEEGDHIFVNPNMAEQVFITGVMRRCEDGIIGRGGQGSVKLKRNMISGEVVAVKTVEFGSQIDDDRWATLKDREREVQSLRHPCLVMIHGCCFDDSRHRMTICMEYVSGPCPTSSECSSNPPERRVSVTLKDVLAKLPSWWTNQARAITVLGIARGIDYIHDCGIMHRDLKPSNILFDADMRPKICDFDVARSESTDDSSASMTMNIGSGWYMAPEVSNGSYTHKADFFSFGVILYEIFEGFESFRVHLRGGCPSSLPQFSDRTPTSMRCFIESCLCEDPDDRCSCVYDESGSLFIHLLPIVLSDLGLDATEQSIVEEYARSSLESGD